MTDGLSGVSAFMGAASFVKDVLDVWDAVRATIEDERATTDLARELQLFAQQELRDDVKLHLEIAQSTLRDHSLSDERKARLTRDYQKLYAALNELPKAVESVLKNNKTGTKPTFRIQHMKEALLPSRSPFSAPAYKTLKAKLENFESRIKQFQTLVMTLRVVGHPKEAMELTSEEFALIGTNTGKGSIIMREASYVTPNWGESTETVRLRVIVEPLSYSRYSEIDVQTSVRTLAAKLRPALPAEHIASFLGYRKNAFEGQIELIFKRPFPEKDMKSMLEIYSSALPEPSLNVKLALCWQLAVAVLQTHTLGLVHKHIRPETLFVASTESKLGSTEDTNLFLCGWQRSRKSDGTASHMTASSVPGIVLYQHPDRYEGDETGIAREKYGIHHDIYSLGVCMLEFSLWEAFIVNDTLSDSYIKAYKKMGYDTVDDSEDSESALDTPIARLYTNSGICVQNTLISLAKEQLPRKVGDRMTRLVCRCLDVLCNAEKRTEAGDILDQFEAEILKELELISTTV